MKKAVLFLVAPMMLLAFGCKKYTCPETVACSKALKTGFEWYRSFPQDEKDNIDIKDEQIDTPVLYLSYEVGNIENYLNGLRENGLKNITGKTMGM